MDEAEHATLESSLQRVYAGGAEMLLISGESGVGKSVLVGELQKQLPVSVRLATGKFDPIGRRIPYAPISRICGEMLRAILSEPPAMLARWHRVLADAVGGNGRVVAEIVPELTLLLGEQGPVEDLDPTQSQNRFERTFLSFLQAFAAADHPLVFFVDDLQWTDAASLRVLHSLLAAPNRAYTLCIGAYRENEVDAGHLLTATLKELRASGTEWRRSVFSHCPKPR
jgi:predicted ATPase